MRHSTLRQLEVFEAIGRLGSFTRAAEELYLTQPTVSMQIKKLTDAVGLPLFEQIGKRVHLTEAGHALYETSRDIFDRWSQLEMKIADLKGLKQGHLQLTVVTTAKYFTPRLLGGFCLEYPGINASLHVTNRERVLERLADNRDDLYVIGQPPEDVAVECLPFLTNPLVVIAPRGHALAGQKQVPLKRLAAEPFVMREPGSGTRMAFERLLEEHDLKVSVRMELGSNEAIKQAVATGLGVSVLSRHTLTSDPGGNNLVVLNVQGFPIERKWYIVYPAGKQLSVVARAFLDHVRDAQTAVEAELRGQSAQDAASGNLASAGVHSRV